MYVRAARYQVKDLTAGNERGVGGGARRTGRRWRQGREETRLGAEGDEEGDGGDGVQDSERVENNIVRNTFY